MLTHATLSGSFTLAAPYLGMSIVAVDAKSGLLNEEKLIPSCLTPKGVTSGPLKSILVTNSSQDVPNSWKVEFELICQLRAVIGGL